MERCLSSALRRYFWIYHWYKKILTHRLDCLLALPPFLSALLGILFASLPRSTPVFFMPLFNVPAVLVSLQVNHPMEPWGRCQCKWLSSLTLAQENTKSALKVSFLLHQTCFGSFWIKHDLCGFGGTCCLLSYRGITVGNWSFRQRQ